MLSEKGAKRCDCLTERAVMNALRDVPRFQTARLSDFDRKVCDFVVNWSSKPGDGLFVTGDAGSGKTHLSAALVRAWFESGRRAMFRRSADLYLAIRQSYSTELGEESLLTAHCSVPLLILDDFAGGSLSDHERRIALEVLDRRMNNELPTVVTSNWKVDAVRERMDDRIGSRLSAFRVMALTFTDRRSRRK